MARISDTLLVQRVDDRIVVMDESTGAEVVFPVAVTQRVRDALGYLASEEYPA